MNTRSWRTTAIATGVVGALLGAIPVQATAAPGPAPRADLRADVDRDGRVDVRGASDVAGEDTWTRGRGAVVLPNVDDDGRRCTMTDARGRPLSDALLARCHDAADTVLNGARDAEDLARLRSVPLPSLADGAHGTARVQGEAAKARIFVKRAGGWKHLKPTTRLTAAELRRGVELGVEATDVVRDAARWDGTVRVRLTVTEGTATTRDDVTLRTAPVLTHHHLQRAKEVLVSKVSRDPDYPEWSEDQHRFVRGLEREVKAAGITKPVRKLATNDVWAQDFVEPGYVSMTGADGRPHALRVMIRSAQDRPGGRQLYAKLRGPDIGVVQLAGPHPSDESQTLNSMGNLETIPPYAHGGKSYPAGRIIMGERVGEGMRPAKSMSTFLASQGAQSPLLLDTSWLEVGHVDEFVQFLPADTPRGWRLGLADPSAGLQLLKDAQAAGNGGKRMFSAPDKFGITVPRTTIAQKLADPTFLADNQRAADKIEANLRVLQRETGLTDAEVVRVPALFAQYEMPTGLARSGRLGRLNADAWSTVRPGLADAAERSAAPVPTAPRTIAYVPGAVNGIVLSDSRYLAPKQWGPVIGGKDVFGEAVRKAYARAGFTTAYLDDYYSYHLGGGEVHCGTNVLRDTSRPWWRS
ncbi:protein-arginine deiminase domain-containing protein [Streptomyces sp. NPDC002490]|uniref:protein-arginine deiminase domain-containing protein n=1 Tax=Streptomyces sp. NPDC002490 TaxID=3154416 RepID=UPI00332214ED